MALFAKKKTFDAASGNDAVEQLVPTASDAQTAFGQSAFGQGAGEALTASSGTSALVNGGAPGLSGAVASIASPSAIAAGEPAFATASAPSAFTVDAFRSDVFGGNFDQQINASVATTTAAYAALDAVADGGPVVEAFTPSATPYDTTTGDAPDFFAASPVGAKAAVKTTAATIAGPTTHLSTTAAGAQITRDNLHWGSTLGAAPAAPISFGFRTSAATYTVPGEDVAGTFSTCTASEQAAARAALQLWSDVANIKFVDLGSSNAATIEFSNYMSTTDQSEAFAYQPGSGNTAAASYEGDVFVNTFYASTTNDSVGTYEFMTFVHEIGHALGLDHPGDYNAGPGQTITYANSAGYIEDSRMYSLMSYFDETNTAGAFSVYDETPMLDDIAAIQRLYGVNTTTRTGDTVYGFSSNAGGPYTITAATQHVAYTVYDAGGIDTLNFSGYSNAQVINLNAEQFSSVGGDTFNVSIAQNVTIENAVGGSGNDAFYLSAAYVHNVIDGGAGTDTAFVSYTYNTGYTLSGTAANFVITGAAGSDTFKNMEFVTFTNGTTVSAATLLTTTPTPPPLATMADLTISKLTTSSASVARGTAYNFSYVVSDTGTAKAIATATGVYVDGVAVSANAVGALSAGGSQTVTTSINTSTFTNGVHTLSIVADSTNAIFETNEANNTLATTFTVTGSAQPDLVIASVTPAALSVVQGQKLGFSYVLKNSGTSTAGVGYEGFAVDQKPTTVNYAGYDYSTGLAANGATTFNETLNTANLSVGTHTLWVGADTWGYVNESDETNNWTAVNFTVTAAPKADLTITGIIAPATVAKGALLNFSYKESNAGAAAAGQNWAGIYLDGQTNAMAWNLIGGVAAGGSQTAISAISTAGLAAGTHTLTITADAYQNMIAEGTETNNSTTLSFKIV